MAITTPPQPKSTPGRARGPRTTPAAEKSTTGSGLVGQLKERGLTSGQKSAQQASTTLTAGLSARGFVGTGPDIFSQLGSALKALQASQGLEITGALDAKTMEALKKMGLVESSIGVAPASHSKDAFEVLQQKGAQTTTNAPSAQPLENAMDTLLGAMKTVLEGMLGEGALNAAGPDADSAAAQAQLHAQGQAADSSDSSHARRDGFGDQDPNGKGSDGGDDSGLKGTAKKKGDKSGRVGDGDEEEGSAAEGEDEDGASADGDEDGTENAAGNASSGDDDLSDDDRGHASDGDVEADRGHYKILPLEDQIREALSTLTRTEATSNRGTTYTLDVVLRKPGVYGPGQSAQELLHLVVSDAGAFDDAWNQARESLRRLCNVIEPKAQLPTEEDWKAALRRARVQ